MKYTSTPSYHIESFYIQDYCIIDFLFHFIRHNLDIIIYEYGEVATDILGVNQSLPSSPSTTMSMMERGDIAMGFNQNKIANDFMSTPTGGEIMITALDSNDTETTRQIKNHVLDIQNDFTKVTLASPFSFMPKKFLEPK